mmetsp:Transcript_32917/g.49609  ORF Transcript_32917/g.49609 Transcript_32917/m.49609 type:complete len:365 (-) Transcript_32917:33-1127(-)
MSSKQPKKGDALDVPSPPNTDSNKRKQNKKRKRSATKTTSDGHDTKNNNRTDWSGSAGFPYPVDYNDHFETPQRAYADIYPLLQYCLQKQKKSNNEEAIIYDPYFCTGTAATLMEQTFKSNKDKSPLPSPVRIHHKKADFYVDVKQNKFPQYDILVTNPPYSSNHKERCLEFAVNQLKRNGRPFFLLMPNYVSTKEYWRKITQNIQVVFIAPSTSHPYEYNHPEGTGHEKSPFESVWFCGVSGNEDMKALKDAFIKFHSKHTTSTPIPRWADSLQGLIQVGGVSGEKRKNPRQRKKMRLLAMQKSGAGGGAAAGPPPSSTQVTNTALSSSVQKKDGKPKKKFDRRKQNSAKKSKKKRLNSGNDR